MLNIFKLEKEYGIKHRENYEVIEYDREGLSYYSETEQAIVQFPKLIKLKSLFKMKLDEADIRIGNYVYINKEGRVLFEDYIISHPMPFDKNGIGSAYINHKQTVIMKLPEDVVYIKNPPHEPYPSSNLLKFNNFQYAVYVDNSKFIINSDGYIIYPDKEEWTAQAIGIVSNKHAIITNEDGMHLLNLNTLKYDYENCISIESVEDVFIIKDNESCFIVDSELNEYRDFKITNTSLEPNNELIMVSHFSDKPTEFNIFDIKTKKYLFNPNELYVCDVSTASKYRFIVAMYLDKIKNDVYKGVYDYEGNLLSQINCTIRLPLKNSDDDVKVVLINNKKYGVKGMSINEWK